MSDRTRYEMELEHTPLEQDPPDDHTPESWRETRAAFACLNDEVPPAPPPAWPEGSVIYFITCAGTGAIKIGTTNNLRARVAQIYTILPYGVADIWFTPGARDVEQEIHRDHHEDRLSGEWFSASESVLAERIEMNCEQVAGALVEPFRCAKARMVTTDWLPR